MKRRGFENMILTHSDQLDDRIIGGLQQWAFTGRDRTTEQLRIRPDGRTANLPNNCYS